jgi:DNA adenine methylase
VIEPTRPALCYHGGKWMLAPWIISHFPPHQVYVEPFGGGASVLLRKRPCYAEVYNDIDDEVVGLFRVLQCPEKSQQLLHSLRLTPFARAEFVLAYQPTENAVEAARRLIIRSFMGYGSDGHNGARPTGFRANSNRSGTTPAHDWTNYPDALALVIDRFKPAAAASHGVIIENRDAKAVMAQHDGPKTLHYVDPPYIFETRSGANKSAKKNYRHELTDADHSALLEFLETLRGMVILSGYPHPMYDAALSGWQRIERASLADGARKRTECLWLNPAAVAAMPAPLLFDAA